MARNETSRLRITLDIDQASGKLMNFSTKVKGVKRDLDSASVAANRFGQASAQAGQQSAAGAVGMQTMAQGALNVTTSIAQTYTSFTNLASAEHRVSLAEVGLARARDLLNNKTLRLQELTERGMGNSRKALLLNNEIITAEADITAKKEKLRIETSKMSDVYILFAVNIMNVAVSLGTTIGGLMVARRATQALRIEQGLTNVSTVTLASTQKMHLIPSLAGMRLAMSKSTIATKGLGFAFKGLMLSMGPIGWAMIGLTTVVALFYPEIEKLSRSALGMSDNMEEVSDKLSEATIDVNLMDKGVQKLSGTMKKEMNEGSKVMIRGLQNMITHADTYAEKLQYLAQLQSTLKATGVGTDFR